MPTAEPALSLHEWIVLSVVREGPTHAYPLAALLGHDGDLGRIWYVAKGMVYRSLDRLEEAGLIRAVGQELSHRGPVRSVVEITEAGRAAARAWLRRPVQHTRDIRSELLVKLALLHRSEIDPDGLLAAQHALLVPIASALGERAAAAGDFDRTLALWRYETVSATLRFLEALAPAGGRG
jgi:DNA-binding PadR family transcriptional regulator